MSSETSNEAHANEAGRAGMAGHTALCDCERSHNGFGLTGRPCDCMPAPAAVEAHAPGPWQVERYGDGDSLVIHSDADTRVCFMATSGQLGNFATIKANAYVIASAPDMLAMLEHVLRWHDQLGPDDVARIEATIAKARGA